MQAVDLLLAPVQRTLENFGPLPSYQYETSVSLTAYERLLAQYNELLYAANCGMLSLRLQTVRLEIENRALRARLAQRSA